MARGADRAAVMATLIMPAKLNDVEPCAFRRRRPRCPAHADHVIRSMTTRAAHERDGAVGFIF
jgi:hypothetical protein